MIFFGTNSSTIGDPFEVREPCKKCGNEVQYAAVVGGWFHLYWIPTFTTGKKIRTVCPACEKVTEENNFSPELKVVSEQIKSSAKLPFWHFSGLGIIGLIVAFIAFSSFADGVEMSNMADNPLRGDVIMIDDPETETEYRYSFYRIDSTVNDSFWLSSNSYSYNGKTRRLDPEDGFIKELSFGYSRSELREILDGDEFVEIIRDYDYSSGFHRNVPMDWTGFFEEMGIDPDSLGGLDSLLMED